MSTQLKVSSEFCDKLRSIIRHGLVSGLGKPTEGELCIEAAICLAKGAPHGDKPTCVHESIRSFSIALNDANWSSNAARATGLERLAIAQLGTNTPEFNAQFFAEKMALYAVRVTVPFALRTAAAIHPDQKHKDALEAAAVNCETVEDDQARAVAEAAEAEAAEAAWAAEEEAAEAARAARRAAEEAARAAAVAEAAEAEAAAEEAAAAARAAWAAARAAAARAAVRKEQVAWLIAQLEEFDS